MQQIYLYTDYISITLTDCHFEKNTTHGRLLYLKEQLKRLKTEQDHLTKSHKKYVPLVLNIPLGISTELLAELSHEIVSNDIDGINLMEYSLKDKDDTNKLFFQSLGFFNENLPPSIPIITSGYDVNLNDAVKRIKLGTKLVQTKNPPVAEGSKYVKKLVGAIKNNY